MIILSSFLLIVAILPRITGEATHSARESEIDWSKCGTQATCYCANSQKEMVQQKSTYAGDCNISMQNIYFGDFEGGIFHLQVFGKGDKPETNSQLSISLHSINIGCKQNINGELELFGDTRSLLQYDIALFESRSRFEDNFYVCAFIMLRASELLLIFGDNNFMRKQATMELVTSSQTIEYKFKYREGYAFRPTEYVCDPYLFNERLSSPEHHVLPVKNRDHHILNCGNYNRNGKPLYSLRYTHLGESFDAKQLECVVDKTDKHIFNFELDEGKTDGYGNPVKKVLTKLEEYAFYCAALSNEVCGKPKECSFSSCPIYKEGSKGQPAEFTCKDKKWIVDGEYVVLEQNAVCARDSHRGRNKFAFFVTLPSGDVKEAEGAGCFTDFDCEKKSPLDLKTATLSHKDGIVKCNDSSINLNIYAYETKQTLNATSFACEPTTGLWKNTTGDTREIIASGSQIRCPVLNITKTTLKADFSQGEVYGAIAAVFFSALIFAALVTLCIYQLCRKRKCHVLGKKDWQKLSRVARLKHCQEVFGKVIKTNPTSAQHIVHGLQQLDMLLDTETADPEIWELVYPFLMRFHGAIVRMDHQIWHMFSLYLYLQAKIIIDKHGWLSSEPIKSDSDKGLMRVVAIRLLTFVIEDPVAANTEAKHMIIDGFRKLRRKGVQQYPHCGVMWNVIWYAARTRIMTQDENGQVGKHLVFNPAKFTRYLSAIIQQRKKVKAESSIPADRVIPAFGTLAEQAAFALGGMYSMDMLELHCSKIVVLKSSKGGAVARSCFKGMCNSLSLNPTPLILDTCGMEKRGNPIFVKLMQEAMTEADLNNILETTSNLLVYYGRQFEAATKLKDYFMPRKRGSINLDELQVEQQEFEKAMQQQLEELREWYAAHTDNDELKTQSVYITSIGCNIKLESRGDEGELKGPETLITVCDEADQAPPLEAPATPTAESPAAP